MKCFSDRDTKISDLSGIEIVCLLDHREIILSERKQNSGAVEGNKYRVIYFFSCQESQNCCY